MGVGRVPGGDQADLDHLTPSTQSPRDDSKTNSTPLCHARGSPENQMVKRFYHTDFRTPSRHQCRLALIPAPWLRPRASREFRPTIRPRKQRPHPQIQMSARYPSFLLSSARSASGNEITEADLGGPTYRPSLRCSPWPSTDDRWESLQGDGGYRDPFICSNLPSLQEPAETLHVYICR